MDNAKVLHETGMSISMDSGALLIYTEKHHDTSEHTRAGFVRERKVFAEERNVGERCIAATCTADVLRLSDPRERDGIA